MSEDMDWARQVAIQTQQQKAQLEESTTDVVLQNLMLDDSDLKRILKGEVQEPLEQLQAMVLQFAQLKSMDNDQAFKILELLRTINSRLRRFQRLIPYVILLSPLMRLTNIDEKEEKKLKRKVSIMIRRDILDMDEEELELTDVNFYDALKIICWNAITDSRMGWKARIATEQRKIITTEFTQPKRKKLLGIF